MILPLPVKKNKFGQRVADILTCDYYTQLAEEIIEANEASFSIAGNDEGLELVDVITTCITRLNIMHWYEDEKFNVYVERIVIGAEKDYTKPKRDFYVELTHAAMLAYSAAKIGQVINILSSEGCAMCIGNIDSWEYDEESALGNIIVMCIKRLEYLGYDEDSRQKLYQAVNDKNQKRGYFDD